MKVINHCVMNKGTEPFSMCRKAQHDFVLDIVVDTTLCCTFRNFILCSFTASIFSLPCHFLFYPAKLALLLGVLFKLTAMRFWQTSVNMDICQPVRAIGLDVNAHIYIDVCVQYIF